MIQCNDRTIGQLSVTMMLIALSVNFAHSAAARECTTARSGEWTEARTWHNGRMPQAGDDVVIAAEHRVAYGETFDETLGKIRVDGTLVFAPRKSLALNLRGNLVVAGKLSLRPADHDVRHGITFRDVDENAYIGGGMKVLDTDVGLWVVGDGRLDATGSAKTSWTRLAGSAAAGQTEITVENADGWQIGDRLEIVPTLPPTAGRACWNGYDSVKGGPSTETA